MLALVLMLAAAGPGAAGQAPSDAASCTGDRYACAVAAYRSDDLATARAAVDALLADRPDDADALLLSGSIALRQHDEARAREALDHAARVAPNYADVFAARARLNLREGRRGEARRDIHTLVALAPDHPDRATLDRQLAGTKATWTAALDHSVSRLSPRSARAWYETRATLVRRQGGTSVALEIERARRFGISDLRFQLGAGHRVGRGSVNGAVVVTPSPHFRETWGLRAGGEYPVDARVDLLVEGRFSNYGRVSSGSVTTAARGWSSDRRTALQLKLINFMDETGSYRAGFGTDVAHEVGARTRVQAGYARYPETEAGVTRRISSAFATGSYRVSETLTVRAGFDHEVRQRAYRRDSVTAGVSVGL